MAYNDSSWNYGFVGVFLFSDFSDQRASYDMEFCTESER